MKVKLAEVVVVGGGVRPAYTNATATPTAEPKLKGGATSKTGDLGDEQPKQQ